MLFCLLAIVLEVVLLLHPGTAAASGNTGSLEPTELVVPHPSMKVTLHSAEFSCYIGGGEGLKFESMDTSVFEVLERSTENTCWMKATGIGTAYMKAVDTAGKTAYVEITVVDAPWCIMYPVVEMSIEEVDERLEFSYDDHFEDTVSVESSDPDIASPDSGKISNIYIGLSDAGTAIITVTDSFGRRDSCKVIVTPPTFSFRRPDLELDSYKDEDSYAFRLYDIGDWNVPYSRLNIYPAYEWSVITSVQSDNEKVAVAEKSYEDMGESYGDFVHVIPIGPGEATITAKDIYDQTAEIHVRISKKYFDEKKKSAAGRCLVEPFVYGDTTIQGRCPKFDYVYTYIKKKEYKADINKDGTFVFNNIPPLPVGTRVTIVFESDDSESDDSQNSMDIIVQPKDGSDLKVSIKDQTYSGKALKPAVNITYKKVKLVKGKDFTVKYSGNKKVGTGKAVITYTGNYTGKKTQTFRINPKGTLITKVKALKNGFSIKWKKQTSQTDGYEIQYSTGKAFKSGVETITVSKSKTASYKVSKLKPGKRYYIRIRTYKNAGKQKFYSSWSKLESIKTKK